MKQENESLENQLTIGRNSLARDFKNYNPSTIQTSVEIMKQRRDDDSLRDLGFFTGVALYTIADDGTVNLNIAKLGTALDNDNVDDFCHALMTDKFYRSSSGMVDRVLSDESTVTVNLDYSVFKPIAMRRISSDGEGLYLEMHIKTNAYHDLSGEQRAVAEAFYGSGEDFETNMKMLSDAGIETTCIGTLMPHYVEENIGEGKALARLCVLTKFEQHSAIMAIAHDIYHTEIASLGLVQNTEVTQQSE